MIKRICLGYKVYTRRLKLLEFYTEHAARYRQVTEINDIHCTFVRVYTLYASIKFGQLTILYISKFPNQIAVDHFCHYTSQRSDERSFFIFRFFVIGCDPKIRAYTDQRI